MSYIYTYRHSDDCKIDGCKNPYSAKGFCRTHYLRWKRHGDPLYDKKKGKGYWIGATCKEEGCNKPVANKGICLMHQSRAYRAKTKKQIIDYINRREKESEDNKG